MTSKNAWVPGAIHQEIFFAKTFVYDRCGFDCTHPEPEAESAEYGAYTFRINGMSVRYRVAKITPTKIGQFVTLWKRKGNGSIEPFEASDDIDLIIISTRHGEHAGQFVFPKAVLISKGIMSANNREGKRGIRVYPPWDKTINKQSQKTQQWQLEYLLEISPGLPVAVDRAKKLFS